MVTDRPIYEFDGVRVDVGRMAAVRGNTAIPLEPKAFDVLIFLIERRDRVVTKEELLDAVWRDTFVTPQGTRIVFERAMESASVWTMTLPSGQ